MQIDVHYEGDVDTDVVINDNLVVRDASLQDLLNSLSEHICQLILPLGTSIQQAEICEKSNQTLWPLPLLTGLQHQRGATPPHLVYCTVITLKIFPKL